MAVLMISTPAIFKLQSITQARDDMFYKADPHLQKKLDP